MVQNRVRRNRSNRTALHCHDGIWRVRVWVPEILVPIVGKKMLIRSLGTDSETEAHRLAPPVIAEFDQIIREAEKQGEVSIPLEGCELIVSQWAAWVAGYESPLAAGLMMEIEAPIFANPAQMTASLTEFLSLKYPDIRLDGGNFEQISRVALEFSYQLVTNRIIVEGNGAPAPIGKMPAAPIPATGPAKASEPVTFTSILANWALENTNAGTFKKFARMMAKLAAFTGTDDARQITPQQIVAFETSLRQAGKLHPNTISNYLGCYNAVFTFAKRKFMIVNNPMEDVKVPGKVETNQQGYTPEQVRHILTEAQHLRIELYLCAVTQAYTGCRISEIADRETGHVTQEDNGIWCLVIPKGKTASSKRVIPLHPAVQRVLLPYRQSVIEQHGDGLLFPELPRGSDGNAKPAAYATRKLCEWIRKKVGITDQKIDPNHAYRHYVKSQLYRAKVDVKTRDMICGHGKSVARQYEHGDIEQMAEAIDTLPNPVG
jgi:integrase